MTADEASLDKVKSEVANHPSIKDGSADLIAYMVADPGNKMSEPQALPGVEPFVPR